LRQTYYSNGKLLITGEYVILDGALSLAIPTQYGQSLIVEPIAENKITWKSLDDNGKVWFNGEFCFEQIVFPFLYEHSLGLKTLDQVSKALLKILFVANQLNKNFLTHYIESEKGLSITTTLDFPQNWGLGSSSTLINNIANWANVDAYQLLGFSLGGSGYDIACAQHDSAITYQLLNKKNKMLNQSRFLSGLYSNPMVREVDFNPEFKDCLYFAHLNRKQNSRAGIEHYKKNTSNISNEISEINGITSKIMDCKRLDEFESLINRHETIISSIINETPVKAKYFKDFKGSIKSLGAWGGDFILATSKENPTDYFKSKGFETVIPFDQMVLK